MSFLCNQLQCNKLMKQSTLDSLQISIATLVMSVYCKIVWQWADSVIDVHTQEMKLLLIHIFKHIFRSVVIFIECILKKIVNC